MTRLIKAKKSLGQNFLADPQVVHRFIESVDPLPTDVIIEIGPGSGALTHGLISSGARVVAIEVDRDLMPLLADRFGEYDNFKLIEADALALDFCSIIEPGRKARVVANLPYNIATAILQRLIEHRHCLTDMTLILQKEVVDRITAPPDSRGRGFISVLVEAYCETKKLFDIAPRSSRPAPKVWSSVVRLTLRRERDAAVSDQRVLWQIVSAGFAQRRKTILNNLRSAPSPLQETIRKHGGPSVVLSQAEIEPQRRAQTLTLDEWLRIVRGLE